MTVVIASNWDCSLPEWLRPDRDARAWWTAWSPRPRSGAAKPDRAHVRAGARDRGRASRRRRCTWATRSRTTWRAPARPGSAAVLRRARRASAGGRGGDPLARRAARPTLTSVQTRRLRTAAPPPPDRPELPEGAAPRWPAWYAGVGFLVGADRHAHRGGDRSRPPRAPPQTTRTRRSRSSRTFLLDGSIFVGTAVLFASFTRKPRAVAVRAAAARRFWPAVGWAALGMLTLLRARRRCTRVIVQPDAEQSVAQDLGRGPGHASA